MGGRGGALKKSRPPKDFLQHIPEWVLIKRPPNLLKCSPYFLFTLNERVH